MRDHPNQPWVINDAQQELDPRVPGLFDDLVVPPPLIEGAVSMRPHHTHIFWMNSGRKSSEIHYDTHDALLMQFFGEKEVRDRAPSDCHKSLTATRGLLPQESYCVEPTRMVKHAPMTACWLPVHASSLSMIRQLRSKIDPRACSKCMR